jgi:hypothetical protein
MGLGMNAALAFALALAAGAACADDASDRPSSAADAAAPAPSTGSDDFLGDWFKRVNEAQASQPHWITPVATVTPRLEEEFRFDFGFQHAGNGSDLTNYGMGKGLELIPTTTNEIIFNLPPYEVRSVKKPAAGFGDDPVLLIKQRFLSANEQNGNYIVTGFLSVQAPTGSTAFTNHAWIVTPTLAAGKGWGDFDIQGTVGVSFPTSHVDVIGDSLAANVAFQYHFAKFFWPEFEVNYTHWFNGQRSGKDQVFLTPGIIFGRFPIAGRAKAIVGVGYQVAVSPKLALVPVLTPMFDHQLILTTRLAF